MRNPILAIALLTCACAASNAALEGSSQPPANRQAAAAPACAGFAPGTPEFQRCYSADRQRQASGVLGTVDTLFRAVTSQPLR